MTYRHCTNLRVPFEPVDLDLLYALPDYRIGQPVPARSVDGSTPLTLTQLNERGFVGLYTTIAALSDSKVMGKTGWTRPEAVLGEEWAA